MSFEIGWGKSPINFGHQGYAMNGYGMPHHQATDQRTPLFARTLVITDASARTAILCCLDMAMVNYAMRVAAVAACSDLLGERFWESGFVLTCTHTHSSPGGCGHEAMYNFVTPGFQQAHVDAVVAAIAESVTQALAVSQPANLHLTRGRIPTSVDVAWNRSLTAYNRNPEVSALEPSQTNLGIDREMTTLSVESDDQIAAIFSLFGVHATALGNHLHSLDGDNKGYASAHAEQVLEGSGEPSPVAIFAQSTAGDVSPHFHGPGQVKRRTAIRTSGDPAYAKRNGELQAEQALLMVNNAERVEISGSLDAVLIYEDFTSIEVEPALSGGVEGARTVDPCHGAAFFAGTPVDGLGAPALIGVAAKLLASSLRKRRLAGSKRGSEEDHRYYQQLYAAQDPKAVVLESGRKLTLGKPLSAAPVPAFVDASVAQMTHEARIGALDTSPLVPTVLPVQILRIGQMALLCCPGEVTTIAGARMRDCVRSQLGTQGVEEVLLLTYSNDYMGYVTTAEEYEQQNYEGGHTIFGKWTLAGFQTMFIRAASMLGRSPEDRLEAEMLRPPAVNPEELALRSNLAPRRSKRQAEHLTHQHTGQ